MATRKLIVEIVGDASSLSRTFRGASDDSARLGGSLGRLSIGLGQLAKGFVAIEVFQKAFQGVDDAVHLGIDGFSDTTKVAAQTAAVIKSTGDASNLSAKQIHALAASLSNVSGIDDEVIQSGENVLASFTQIRDFAGKNNDIFTRATDVLTDYVSRTGKSATTAATIIGRALADPATKAVALSRAGIVLTKSQLDALKAIEKTSGVVAAQKVLLGDLEARFKGAAAAAGDTFVGQLNTLRERFKDLAGELVGDVTPAFKGAVAGLRGFVVELTEAKGGHAKFDVVVDGLDNLGSKIKAEFDKVDFRGIASRVGTRLGDAIRSVNWKLEIEKAGKAAGDALAATFNGLSSVLERVDWNKVGRVIVDGLGKAIGAVLLFLHSVDWSKVGAATFRLLVAGFRAQQELLAGIGEAIGKALLDGIGRGLDSVGPSIEAKAIKIVLGIIDPFTSIPSFLGPEGGIARNIKSSLHATLDALNAPSAADGASVGESFVAGILATVTQAQGALAEALKTGIAGSQAAGVGSRNTGGVTVPNLPPPPPPPKAKGLTATQRNTFFDNAISSDLTRAGFITNVKQQIGALQTIAGLVSARIAATKDVTRRRTLEDQLLSVKSQIAGDQAQVGSDFIASLQFGLTKAQATAGFGDDLKALDKIQAALKAQIKATGATLDLRQQLFDVQQQIASTKLSAKDAAQFKFLGLGPTGEALAPSVGALKKSLGTISDAVAGTFLDTKANESLFAKIRDELKGNLKGLSDNVRTTIASMLDDINNQLDNAGARNLTKFRHVSQAALLAGLTPEDQKTLGSRLAQIGANGSIPSRGSAFALAGSVRPVQAGKSSQDGGITITGDLVLQGVQNVKQLKNELVKEKKRRSISRRT